MRQELKLFIGMFTTLLAIINPLEALPVFLKLLDGKSEEEHRRVAVCHAFMPCFWRFSFSSLENSLCGFSEFHSAWFELSGASS